MHRCSRFNISYCKEIVRIDRNFNSFDTSSISSPTSLSVSSNGKKRLYQTTDYNAVLSLNKEAIKELNWR